MNQNKSAPNIAVFSLTHVFLFLTTFNVLNRYYIFAFLTFGIYVLSRSLNMYITIDTSLVCLLLFGVFWIIFSPNVSGTIFSLLKPFIYLIFYALGCAVINDLYNDSNGNEKYLYKTFYTLVFIIASGPFVHLMLNFFSTVGSAGVTNRNTVDFWTKEVLSATGQATLACIAIGLAVSVIFSHTRRIFKVASITALVLIFAYNLILSGRTIIVLILICLIFSVLHILIVEKKLRLKVVLAVCLAIFLLIFLYSQNVFNIKESIENSLFYERLFGNSAIELTDDVRIDRKIYYLKNFFDHMFGGGHFLNSVGYAHDIFLDTYDEAGIFALLFMAVYIISALVRCIKCLFNENLSFTCRQITVCIYLVFFVQFMVEPILQGTPWLFAYFCLFDGAANSISNSIIKRETIKASN